MLPKSTPPLIVGNWKMYKTSDEATHFVEDLKTKVTRPVWIAVPFTMIQTAAKHAKDSPIVIGAQNMNDASEGSFTGEVSAKMLLSAGAQFVILGHSERRTLFHESNEFIQKKVARALKDQLKIILCIGETEMERAGGQTKTILKDQLESALKNVTDWKNVVIAYEPVWAIGGQAAEPDKLTEEYAHIEEILTQLGAPTKSVPTLYGGSVNVSNAPAFLKEPAIDGLLIGSASLNLDSFAKIASLS